MVSLGSEDLMVRLQKFEELEEVHSREVPREDGMGEVFIGTPTGSPRESDADQLVRLLEENNLSKHAAVLMDPDGDIGLRGLQDLCDLSPEDIEEIVKAAGFNIGERKRLLRAVAKLQKEKKEKDEKAAEEEASKKANTNAKGAELLAEGTEAIGPAYDDPVFLTEDPKGSERYFDVVKTMVFVRSAPRKDALGIGILRNGMQIQVRPRQLRDSEGGVWVELTKEEFFRSCEPEPDANVSRGFALIDGTHAGLGLLLQGPVRKAGMLAETAESEEQQRERQQKQNEEYVIHAERMRRQEEARRKEQERQFEQKRFDEQQAISDALESARREAEWRKQRREDMTNLFEDEGSQDSAPFRALGMHVQTKMSLEGARTKKLECRPGTFFHMRKNTAHRDKDGCLWMERATPGNSIWILIEDTQQELTYLLKDSLAQNHATISIDYLSNRNEIRVFEGFVNVQSPVRLLNAKLCAETNLKPKSTFLFRTRPPVHGMPRKQDIMEAPRSLESYGIHPGADVDIYLGYPFGFEKDYRGGAYLRQ